MIKIAIINGSTRPGGNGSAVAQWVMAGAQQRDDADYQLLHVSDFELPVLDEPMPPAFGQYSNAHTKAWSAAVATFDGFVFVTPEYNHSTSGALKNALDYLYNEWVNKAAGFVSYGSMGGVRAVEHLRGIMAELQIADVRAQVTLSLHTDFENYRTFVPAARHDASLDAMFGQVVAWSRALAPLRAESAP